MTSFKKKLFIFIIFLLSINAHSAGLTYYPYACDYFKNDNNEWELESAVQGGATNTTGWNTSLLIYQYIILDGGSITSSLCTFTHSFSPDDNYIVIRQVEGTDLKTELGTCAYSGKSVQFSDHSKSIDSSDSVFSLAYNSTINRKEYSFFHVSGIRSDDGDDTLLRCEKELKEKTGGQVVPRTNAIIRIKRFF